MNVMGGHLRAEWNGDNLRFTSTTAYTDFESGYLEDVDGSPTPVATMGYDPEDLNSNTSWWTQEFNLSGGDRFRWVVGAFYLNIEDEGISELVFRETLAGDAAPLGDNSATQSEVQSWSLFGQMEYDLSDSWRLVAGLRYTDENKKQAAQPFTQFYSTGEIILGDPFAVERNMDQPWSGKLALEFYPSDNVMTYISYNRGIKSGGFNPRSNNNPTFDDEQLNAFELGLKAQMGSATSLNVAAFYYDYVGYQIRTLDFDSLSLETLNADSTSYGMEVELFSKPTQNLDLSFGLSLLDAEVYDIAQIFNGVPVYWEERVMQQAPPYTFNGAITYSIPLGSAGSSLDLHTNWNLVGEQEYSAYNHPSMVQESYTYGYASIKYRPPKQNWEIYAWVKNIMNEVYIKGGDDLSFFGLTTQPINAPRWIGLTFRVNFGL
jgi:iron complex outermembrane receptor protein